MLAYLAALGLAVNGSPALDAAPVAPGEGLAYAPARGQQPAQFAGDDTCLDCHEDKGTQIKGTMHGRAQHPRTPAATGRTCETCHGPGKAHVDAAAIRSSFEDSAPCRPATRAPRARRCHNRGTHVQWSGSMHDQRNVSCVTCHSVHSPKSEVAQLKKATEIETCAQCHKPQVLKVAAGDAHAGAGRQDGRAPAVTTRTARPTSSC